jgi:L-ornithine Nalpha-acyltransferase
LPDRFIEMRRMNPDELDAKRTLSTLPPLIKGYLRLGGFVGDGAVIDEQFNTTDVAIIVKTDLVTDKYYRHYERQLRDALD